MRTQILAATAALPPRTKTGLVVLGVVTVLLGSACAASHGVKTQSDVGAKAGSTTSSSAATVGSRIVLDGQKDGERVAVTLTNVHPFARLVWNPMDGPRPARNLRIYAAQFRLTNIGSVAYSDWPSNGAQVVDSTGRSYDFYGVAPCLGAMDRWVMNERPLGTPLPIPGSSALACVAWAIPKHATITDVRFTPDSGFGPGTGQWNVG